MSEIRELLCIILAFGSFVGIVVWIVTTFAARWQDGDSWVESIFQGLVLGFIVGAAVAVIAIVGFAIVLGAYYGFMSLSRWVTA